ncbi:MAG TPA: hypothetical protein VLJ10_01760 [Candidatus Bathyarchaeia archaeon]|nr:hypothetical protein [Candidatus Bathyarchaeia archaeon]
MKKTVGEHDLVDTCIKITPCLRKIFTRYSDEKGRNRNNRKSLAHGIRLAGVALMKKYGIKEPENLSVNYQ